MRTSVIITGGNGLLGRCLVSLLKQEFSLLVIDLEKHPGLGVESVECDVSKFDLISDIFERTRPHAVVHLAAITGVERCRQKASESFLTNVTGTLNVAWVSALYGSRLLFASSREVYGETVGAKTAENAELKPNNLYGLTKMIGELAIRWVGTTMGLPYVILRFTNLYGPGGDQYAVAALIKKAIRGEEIPIFGGEQVLNLIHVQDAARALQMCLAATNLKNSIFNIGSNETVRVKELVNRIIQLSNSNSSTTALPMRIGETLFFNPDLSRARNQLGFESTIGLDRGLTDCVDYYHAKLM